MERWLPASGRGRGGAAATFNGRSDSLRTDGPLVATTGSFAVAAWVRLGTVPTWGERVIAAQGGTKTAGFQLGTRMEGSSPTPRWAFTMTDADEQSSTVRAAFTGTAITEAQAHEWTHIAGVYDHPAGKIRLYLNGKMAAEADRTAPPWAATGQFAVGSRFSTGPPGGPGPIFPWEGFAVADVQAFGRVLVQHDFTGQLASDEFPGGFNEPGILAPVEVGRWDFNAAVACYEVDTPGTCEAPDGSAWDRRLRLSEGTGTDRGNRGPGLALSDVHYVDDPKDPKFGKPTQQYGTSQANRNPETGTPSWQNDPVLHTGLSFTVSVWAQAADLSATMTALGQRGDKMSVFNLGTRKSTVGGVTAARWEVMTASKDDPQGVTYSHVIAPAPLVAGDDDWTHLTVVYDAGAEQLRLYVNGGLAAAASQPRMWHAGGPLAVGRAWTTGAGGGAWVEQWRGGIDDLLVYQGAMTDAQVLALHDRQSAVED